MENLYKCYHCNQVFEEEEIQWDITSEDVSAAGEMPSYIGVNNTKCPNCSRTDSLEPYYDSSEGEE